MLGKSTPALFDEKQLISAIESEKLSALDLSATRVKDEKAEMKTTATLAGHMSSVDTMAVLPDGRLASGSYDTTIRLWEVKSGKCVATLTGHTSTVWVLAVLPDGRLASGSTDNTIRLWEVKGGKCVATWRGHTNSVNALTVLPDGRLVSGSADNTIRLWEIKSGKCVATLAGHTKSVYALAVLPDGRLASGSWDKTICLWEVKSGKCVATLTGHERWVNALAVLPDGCLASGSTDKTIRLWDTKSEKCVATLNGHAGTVYALAVLPGGRLASGSSDNTIRLWEVKSGTCVAILSGHTDWVYALAVLPDGRLASGSKDSTVRLWEVASLRPLAFPHFKAVLTALQKNKSVRALNLQNTALSDEAIPELVTLLKPNTALTELDIRHTAMTTQGVKALVQALQPRTVSLRIYGPDDFIFTLAATSAPAALIKPEVKPEELALTLGKKLGRGSYGVVYQGTWRHGDAAIKQLLTPSISSEVLKEFKAESEIMAKLRSHYLVQFYGYCLSPKYMLVTQYMPKGSLFTVLHSETPLDWTLRSQIITDMACGLEYLHTEKILHRDLKSLNVLLDEQYRAKLSDFGLSQVKNEIRSMRGGPVGTLAWIAPELAEFEAPYTPKTDIYSLGITFWEIATRKVPFASAVNPALIPTWAAQGKREKIPDDCPKKIASLIRFCWNTDPDKRPTAAEVVNYLKSNQDEFKPVPANAVSAPSHLGSLDSQVLNNANNAVSYQDNLTSAPKM